MTQGDIGYLFSVLDKGIEEKLSGNDKDVARAISSIIRGVMIDLNRSAAALETIADCQRLKHD